MEIPLMKRNESKQGFDFYLRPLLIKTSKEETNHL